MSNNQLYQLLDEFKKLSSIVVKNPTFMEIAGYPHYETVCSNILAFYLQPDSPHGLGDLCLRSLLALASCEDVLSNVVVKRELITDSGNRIDIVVSSDTHLIAIENKIYHSVNNPLEDYASFLDQNSDNKKILMFIISVYPITQDNLHGFIPVQYLELFSKIRPLIGEYISTANTKFLLLITDFIETIENLTRGSAMSQDLITFFQEKNSDIVSLLEAVSQVKSEMRNKITELRNLIDIQNKSIPIKQGFYAPPRQIIDYLYYDLRIADDLPIAIDCYISAAGWTIAIFVRRGGNLEKLKSLLNSLDIPFKNGEYLQYPTKYLYNEPITTLQAILQDIIDKITSTANASIEIT